jgi:Zn-dependent M16 (insulinase) family peptidase
VNYVGKAANLYEDAGYKLSGASYVVNKFLGTTWLWDRVRVVGGAYGGFSDFDSHSGERQTAPSYCMNVPPLSWGEPTRFDFSP